MSKKLTKEQKAKKELDEFFNEWDELQKLPEKEREKKWNERLKIEANKFRLRNIDANTKFNGLLTSALIIIGAVALFLQYQTNKTNSESVEAILRQDTTNQRSFELMKEEFELNYRPFLNIVSFGCPSEYSMGFEVNNCGNVPALYQLKSIKFFSEESESRLNIETDVSIIYPVTKDTPFAAYINPELYKRFLLGEKWNCEVILEYRSLTSNAESFKYYYKHTVEIVVNPNDSTKLIFPVGEIDAN
uniref:hypothetical protein n=1 Tax=uncultured Draconibacterium sp. TaxID=1573823 RepID=UPI0032169130